MQDTIPFSGRCKSVCDEILAVYGGKYEPQSPKIGKFFTIGLHDRQIHDVLRNQKCKILCINDTENIGDFRQQKRNIKDSFESILPEKSAFELSYKDSGGMYDKKCD